MVSDVNLHPYNMAEEAERRWQAVHEMRSRHRDRDRAGRGNIAQKNKKKGGNEEPEEELSFFEWIFGGCCASAPPT